MEYLDLNLQSGEVYLSQICDLFKPMKVFQEIFSQEYFLFCGKAIWNLVTILKNVEKSCVLKYPRICKPKKANSVIQLCVPKNTIIYFLIDTAVL